MIDERDIQRQWSADPKKYYEEKKRFLKEHIKKAAAITTDLQGNLVSATYYFAPYQAYKERQELLAACKQAAKEQDKEGGRED